jgi:uncharacterized protein (DUF427 family)
MDDSYTDENNRLLAAPTPRWMQSPKWIRVYFGGEVIADSKRAHLLREGGPPVYYFPEEDVRSDLFMPSDFTKALPRKGDASYWSVSAGGRVAENGAWTFREPPEDSSFVTGYVALDWGKMDAWFEEKEEVFVHARDPFKRIDTVKSDRQVRVVVAGETVAESTESVILLEPGHPIRYYLPKADVRMGLLRPSETVSRCAYKGEARYYSLEVGGETAKDLAWSYTYPTPESTKVMGMVCFFNERVDAIFVDGDELPKPQTNWAR